MKKIIIKLCLVTLTVISLSACKKWLAVQPEDKFTEEQIFSKPQGFEEAINGIYIGIGSQNLYGRNLTLSTLDIFAQRYEPFPSDPFKDFYAYNYFEEKPRRTFDAIWGDAYVNIGNVNHLLVGLDKYAQNLAPERAKLIRGEALALRAFLHFDLLRMYGPVYNSADSTRNSIPYYTELSPKVNNFEPANVIMDKVLNDLKQAELFLADDPVKNEGGRKNLNSYRFNYYAVKALQARVLLWRNDGVGALKAAKTVIDATNLFPWVLQTDITGDFQNPDRIFSSEILFGTFSKDLYLSYQQLFYYELSATSILASGPAAFIDMIYDSNSADYRRDMWRMPPLGVTFPTLIKYADVVDKTKSFRNTIALMRLSEMYYIAAETEPNATLALNYLNTVRNHRGVISLVNPTSLSTEILKEYRKEFFGEGQLWFYYKRKKISSVIVPPAVGGLKTIPAAAWSFPVPEAELANR